MYEEFGLTVLYNYRDALTNKDMPTVDDIAMVYTKIIDAVYPTDYREGILDFYNSFLQPLLEDYGNNLYWANREYLVACYREGYLL